MSTSTARQLEFTDLEGASQSRGLETGFAKTIADGTSTHLPVSSAATLQVPQFGHSGEMYANTWRLAGRLNAASISQAEHDAFLRERQLLLQKVFDRSISRKEKARLEYVRWSLDRIEDARYGHSIDILESRVVEYERFAADLRKFDIQLNQHLGRRK